MASTTAATIEDQRSANLRRATAIRQEARTERDRLLAARDWRTLAPALIDPTPEFAVYSLASLFGRRSTVGPKLLAGISAAGLRRLLAKLTDENPLGREWHEGLKLRDLTERERRRLVRALLAAGYVPT
jgi:hypothetical protein